MKQKYIYTAIVLIIIFLAIAGFLYWQENNDGQRKVSFENCTHKCGYPSLNQCKASESFAQCTQRCMSDCEKQNNVTMQELENWGYK